VGVALLAMMLVGMGTIAQAAATNMMIQARVDDTQRGRVMAIYTAMFLGAMPFGSLAFGRLGHSIGAMQALCAGAVLALLAAVLGAAQLRVQDRRAAVP
jgi:predicted MFS family arabinose efflux permease